MGREEFERRESPKKRAGHRLDSSFSDTLDREEEFERPHRSFRKEFAAAKKKL